MLGIVYPLVLQLVAFGHEEETTFNKVRRLGGNSTPSTDEEIVVTRDDFREKLRGHSFDRWSDFKNALGKKARRRRAEPEVDGGVRLMSGLSIAFVVILNVLIWTVVAYVIIMMEGWSSRAQGWIVLAILCVYGTAVYAYCQYAYANPQLRLITNFLFGLVPLTVSCASYVLALLVLDLVRGMRDGFELKLSDRMKPWEEEFDGRLIFFLAVLPGLVVSIYLGNTVSTGFKTGTTYLDVLSLCLFIDVGRFAGHFSYLVAREWSIGKSPTSISSRPGLAYVLHGVCFGWYLLLARLEAGKTTLILADGTKKGTLVSLTSYVFFPLSLYLGYMNLREFFDQFALQRKWLESLGTILMVFAVAVFMLLVAVVFNAIEPNMMGIGALLFCVFYGAYSISQASLLGFILAMVPLALVAYGAAVLSTTYAQAIRQSILYVIAK